MERRQALGGQGWKKNSYKEGGEKKNEHLSRIIWNLFFKIGAFTIGGGYAMVPLIENGNCNQTKMDRTGRLYRPAGYLSVHSGYSGSEYLYLYRI